MIKDSKASGLEVLIPFLAGLLFGPWLVRDLIGPMVLIPFLAGLLFGRYHDRSSPCSPVLIPFLAGLLFGLNLLPDRRIKTCLNPLFGGSAFRTLMV